jgi:hypothetical protein
VSGRRAAPPQSCARRWLPSRSTKRARLALCIAAWFATRLRDPERKQVSQAKEAAILALRSELDMTPTLRSELGLPSRVKRNGAPCACSTSFTHKVWNLAA